MRKFTYWVCRQEHDAECYNLRARTKKEAAAQRARQHQPGRFTVPFKVQVEYTDLFDLVDQLLSEGGPYEYPRGKDEDRVKRAEKKERRAREREFRKTYGTLEGIDHE